MSDPPIEPLSGDLDGLLAAERAAEPPADALDRVWPRVEHSFSNGGTSLAARSAWPASKVWAVAGAAFLSGAVIGGTVVAILHRPTERVVYVEPAVPSPTPLPSSTPAPSIEAASPRDTPSDLPASHVDPSASSSSLYQERLLLDAARSALSDHAPERALTLLDEHARRFSHPQLGEDREALAIQALVSLGHYDAARARAARFRSANPRSLFMPAIDATLTSIP